MALMSEYQKRQLREAEIARFDRWFVDTVMGPAYRGRDGRVRSVKPDEVARWRTELEAHIEAMIAGVPAQVAWAVGALLVIVIGGDWLLDRIAVPQRFHAPAIGLGLFIVEAGMIGLDAWDYIAGWRARREGIEAAVAARAPLPIDPARLGSPHNWFQIGLMLLIAPILFLALFSHLDAGLIERIDPLFVIAVVPAAWALHFASKWHDRRAKGRLRS
jgi:hypothetical protein